MELLIICFLSQTFCFYLNSKPLFPHVYKKKVHISSNHGGMYVLHTPTLSLWYRWTGTYIYSYMYTTGTGTYHIHANMLILRRNMLWDTKQFIPKIEFCWRIETHWVFYRILVRKKKYTKNIDISFMKLLLTSFDNGGSWFFKDCLSIWLNLLTAVNLAVLIFTLYIVYSWWRKTCINLYFQYKSLVSNVKGILSISM